MLKIFLGTGLLICLMISGYFLAPNPEVIPSKTDITKIKSEKPTEIKKLNSEWNSDIQNIILDLQQQYQDQIHLTYIQAKIIYIREHLAHYLPAPINKQLKKVLVVTFPGYADAILSTWARLDQYQRWLVEQNRTLMELDTLSRGGMLWKKRTELFPLAAHQIWTEEQDSYEAAQLELHTTIDALDIDFDLPMRDRVERLQSSFQQANSIIVDTINAQTGSLQGTIASVLFGLDSVQKDLRQLTAEDRQQQIEDIRLQLGFDEQTIKKMAIIDDQRQERWDNGNAYMASREKLLADNGEISANQLNILRSEYFGKSSITIAKEEEDGFFRFQRPRYYGRN